MNRFWGRGLMRIMRVMAVVTVGLLAGCSKQASPQERGTSGTAHDSGLPGPTERLLPRAAIPPGTYVGNGIWGPRASGKLTVVVAAGACTARYESEASLLCTETRVLTCQAAGTAATLRVDQAECTLSCAAPEGAKRSPCEPEDRLRGEVRSRPTPDAVPGPDAVEFAVDEAVLARRRRQDAKTVGAFALVPRASATAATPLPSRAP